MSRSVRTYDVDEANLVLPLVRRVAAQISELSNQLPELQDQVRIAEYRMKRAGAGTEESDRFEQAATALRASEDDLREALAQVGRLGVTLKDARAGLIDFFSHRGGELVELCWKLGEDRVAHWHRVGEGFAGRKPL